MKPASKGNQQRKICILLSVLALVRAGSHFDISISISRHTQKQYDADNWHLLLGKFPTKGANYQHRTASAYVGLMLMSKCEPALRAGLMQPRYQLLCLEG